MRIFSLTLALQAAVQLTLVTGAIPNRPRSLLEAARTGDIDMVELFLSSRRDDLNAGYRGWTPLHEASRKGHSEVVKLLLSHGANPRIAFNGRLPPITIAARHGHAEIVKLLVENGDASPDSLAAAMLFAAYNDRSEVVDYLLAHDANLANARNNGGFHSTELSAENKSGPFGTESSSVLEAAVINDHLDMVAKLVQNGARVNHEEFDRACYFGRKAIVKFLIDNGAEIEPAGLTDWWIPITSAVSTNKIDIVELLIQRGATRGFEVALLIADREYKPRIINLFAEAGLVKDYEIPDELDHSPVFGNYQIPVEFDDWHIIKHLLLAGAKNTVNSDFVLQDLMLPITMIH